ncbi:D-aminoacyl-tRNA deacylase [Actinomycetospora sp.]|uniref:D-aminoacyl-tRNA deacylase n=1 Tax=Actinomycetospora sp. TaxID=1872135 RepID=UPI002F3FF7BF
MKAVVARVSRASVSVGPEVVGALEGPGLLVLLGVHRDDPARVGTADDPVPVMARKVHELRLFGPGERSDGRCKGERSDGGSKGERSDGGTDGERSDGGSTGERSCAETGAGLLVVSQFTLYGDTRKGRRPSWSAAAPAEDAERLVDAVVATLRDRGATVATGVFGADMAVESVNDGPFTVIVEV